MDKPKLILPEGWWEKAGYLPTDLFHINPKHGNIPSSFDIETIDFVFEKTTQYEGVNYVQVNQQLYVPEHHKWWLDLFEKKGDLDVPITATAILAAEVDALLEQKKSWAVLHNESQYSMPKKIKEWYAEFQHDTQSFLIKQGQQWQQQYIQTPSVGPTRSPRWIARDGGTIATDSNHHLPSLRASCFTGYRDVPADAFLASCFVRITEPLTYIKPCLDYFISLVLQWPSVSSPCCSPCPMSRSTEG